MELFVEPVGRPELSERWFLPWLERQDSTPALLFESILAASIQHKQTETFPEPLPFSPH